jgi:hypothetical protein
MSDLAYSIRSFAEDLRSELDYRTLCDDEREELDQKRDTKKEAA